MRKLNILITQYKETDEEIKPLLDSIQIQQRINFEDIEVIIGNNGSDVKLTDDFINHYSYPIKYIQFKNTVLGGNRQNLMGVADAEYVMWCDADDMFYHALALHKIFQYIEQGFDVLFNDFIEELFINEKYYTRRLEEDHIHVHGKVYRRQFILDNKMNWCDKLSYNEDGCFNVLGLTLSKKTYRCKEPYYIWKWNPKSKTRSRKYNNIKVWIDMLQAYYHLIDNLLIRGYGKEARYYAVYGLYASYYMFKDPGWQDEWEGKDEHRIAVYKKLLEYLSKYELLLKYVDDDMRKGANEVNRKLASRKMKVDEIEEFPDIERWVESIKSFMKKYEEIK